MAVGRRKPALDGAELLEAGFAGKAAVPVADLEFDLGAAEPLLDDGLPAESDAADDGLDLAPHKPRRRFWEPYRVFLSVMLGALLLALLGVALWLALPIRSVQVQGNTQLSQTEVRRLAGLDTARPFGWLYYGAWRAGGLRDNAWVESARITRIFPDRILIVLKERVAVAQLRSPGGQMTVLAADGTPLPVAGEQLSAAQQKPLITGWGPDRTADALYAVQALARYNVKSVDYSPTGITIQTDKGRIWSGDRELLIKYASALEQQTAGKRINLYPWGVSVE